MSGFGVLILFFLTSMLFLCNGKVNPPPDGTRLTFLKGSTATIQWSYDGVSGILARTWSFINSDGSEAPIARIIMNNTPEIDSSFPRAVSVKTPATLILHNVTEKYNGTYKFILAASLGGGISEVVVYIAVKPRNTEVKFSKNPAVINGSVAITCTSDGFPELSYAFSHNDTDLNSTGNVYVIHNVAWKNAGTYNCTANNTLGIDSDSKILTVIRESKSSSAIMASSTIMPSPTVIPSLRTPAPTNTTTPTSNTTGNGTNDNGSKGSNIPAIAGGAAAGGAALATMAAAYYKSKKRDNKRVISNYGMEAIDYDTVKPPDKGEGSQKTEKPEDSHENRKGNTER